MNINFTSYITGPGQSYINDLVGVVQGLLDGGSTVTPLSEGSGSAFFPGARQLDQATQIYTLTPSTVAGLTSQDFTIPGAGYVLDTVGGSVSISAAVGDTILVSANNPLTTVVAAGSDQIIFVDGNNLYDGSGSAGGDTVIGGSGNDTMMTGANATTISSGTGYDSIVLNDTGSSTAYNDQVYLDNGHATVIADGTGDYVVATAAGQTVDGSGQAAGSNLTVVLAGGGGDSITGGAGFLTVGDAVGGNTITGGEGGLTFIGGENISDTVTGANFVTIFSNAGDNLTGGFGDDTMVAGGGNETLTGGAGANVFLIDAYGSQGGNITIGDFMGSDSVAFGHYSAADVQAAISGGSEVDGNFVITFATSSTTVTFVGVTDGSQLDGHTITFT